MQPPSITRSVTLNFVGDWGQANFHRICSWLSQEICDRSGPRTRVGIWNVRGGGIDALHAVHDGEAQLSVATPAALMTSALTGDHIFAGKSMPDLRALAVLPQNDRMVLAIDPRFGISTFAELREARPPLRIVTSRDDGTNFIGYVAQRYMEAHGIDRATLQSWGGGYVETTRPEQSLFQMRDGLVDAVLQEAIMTPWWADVMDKRRAIALPAEADALARLKASTGLGTNSLPAGYWPSLTEPIDTLDFSDFVIFVRDDMPDDLAFLITWALVETRGAIERQYKHLPPERSPLTYPLDPAAMARTPLPLHPAAERYYVQAGRL